MKKSDITYNDLQRYVKNKDVTVTNFVNGFLNRLQSMFVYHGLPDTVNARAMEQALQVNGNVGWVDVDGKLYALQGATGGEFDAYGQPTVYTIANPWLQLSKTYTIGKDCVLMRNDWLMQGVMPTVGKYAVLLTDTDITLNTLAVLARVSMLISAADDKTKASADMFVKKILDGDFSVIGENAFFDGVKLQTLPTSSNNNITQIIELLQYYKASFYNEIGLNANYNMKRERLTVGELEINVDALLPLADNMLYERKQAINAVNEMFGTEITVEFGSSWRTVHEQEEQMNDAVDNGVDEHEPTDEPTHEPTPTDPEPVDEPDPVPTPTDEPNEPEPVDEPTDEPKDEPKE